MKRIMKVVKGIGGIAKSYEEGELVEAEKVGDYYRISPPGKSEPILCGVSPCHLQELDE